MKVCIVCGQEKPLDQFPTNRGMKDGHLGWCFECFAHRHKFYHYPPPPKPKEYLAIVEVIKMHFGLK